MNQKKVEGFAKIVHSAGFLEIKSVGISIGNIVNMKRENLEHIIRAAGAIAGVDELVLIGSQAILGAYPNPPEELLVSMEIDLYPLNDIEKADLIDGSIGEESPFHEEFGYYAHGVGPETAVLPVNWKERLIIICNENTNNIKGLCLHPIDIAVSKLIAGRKKDFNFVKILIEHTLVKFSEIDNVLDELPVEQRIIVENQLKTIIEE